MIGPSWVGDMVMAQSLFKVLLENHPQANIDVLAPAWSQALTNRMPEVRSAITAPSGHGELGLGKRIQLASGLRKAVYDWAIVLPNSLKSALIPFFARIPERTGFVGEMRYGLLNDARHLDKQALPMTVQRFVALGLEMHQALPDPLPMPKLTFDAESAATCCWKFGLSRERPMLALCPGAEYGPAKRWPEKHYAETARYFLNQGWQVGLFGSEKDRPVTAGIDRLAGDACIDLAGQTTMTEVIDLLSVASAVVSNDSGLMHVAAALDRELVAIYGSSDPGFTPPLSGRAKVVSLGLDCSPCFKRECPLGHLNCLNDITPEKIINQIALRKINNE